MEKSKRTCYEWTGETIFSRSIREQNFSQPGSEIEDDVSKTLYLQKIRSTSRRWFLKSYVLPTLRRTGRPSASCAVECNCGRSSADHQKNQFNTHTHTHSHTNRDEALRQNVPLKINAFEREDFLFFSPFRRPPFNPPGDRTLAALTRGGAAPAAHNSTRTDDTPNNFNNSPTLRVRKGQNTQTLNKD